MGKVVIRSNLEINSGPRQNNRFFKAEHSNSSFDIRSWKCGKAFELIGLREWLKKGLRIVRTLRTKA